MNKRLDLLLYEQGLAPSREKAKALILAGLVKVDGVVVSKPAASVPEETLPEVTGENEVLRYVSRGGLKLEKALSTFGLSPEGLVCMDVGASTGGFTDCMLMNGAKKVYSIDSGSGQLAEKLLCDPRVVNLEKTNIRYVDKDVIEEPVSFVSVDVSFISLTMVLPVLLELTSENVILITLIKPQFEAGKDKVGKKGVVRDRKTHREVISTVLSFADSIGWKAQDLTFSPVKGPEGNIEYLACFTKSGVNRISDRMIEDTVMSAHSELDH